MSLWISILSYGTAFFAIVITAAYLYFGRRHDHWKKKGVTHLKPLPFVGTMQDIAFVRKNVAVVLKEVYDKYKKEPFIGLYAFDEPVLHIHDLSLIKAILIKDFQYFCDRNFKVSDKIEPLLARGLMSLKGDRWRHSRNAITPSFTSGKMKRMFEIANECGKLLAETLEKEITEEPVVAYEIAARYTTEVIASCIFGIQSNTLGNDKSDFRSKLRLVFELTPIQAVKNTATLLCPKLMELLNVKVLNPEVERYVTETIRETIKFRRENGVKRNDLLESLIEIMNNGELNDTDDKKQVSETKPKISMSELDVTGHSFTFLAAGFETSATTMSYVLYELAKNKEVQDRLRDEILEAEKANEGHIPYDALHAMEYMDRVIQETLRKYPPVGFIDRINNNPYRLPGYDLTLEAGTVLLMPVLGIHRDPQFYPSPMQFDPERFIDENKASRPSCTYLPFGEGPRACVGLRFALMQTKIGLVHILKGHSVHPSDVTPAEIEFSAKTFLSQPQEHVRLHFRERQRVD